MNDNKNDSFLDSKTILAIVLCGLVFFGWQTYLAKKYPQKNPDISTTTSLINNSSTPLVAPVAVETVPSTSGEQKIETPQIVTESFSFDDLSFNLSSSGMKFSNVVVNRFTDRLGQPVKLGDESSFFHSFISQNKEVVFNLERKSSTEVVGTAVLDDGTEVYRNFSINTKKYLITDKLVIKNASPSFSAFSLKSSEKWWKPESSSFLFPSFDHQDIVSVSEGSTNRENASSRKEVFKKTLPNLTMGSIGTQYFVAGVVDKSKLAPSMDIEVVPNQFSQFSIVYNLGQSSSEQIFELTYYFGPKSIDTLKAADPQLAESINLGFFASIGKVLLLAMKWFHTFIPNWGVAIILLTLLVKVIVLPFNIASYKSMKKMQNIQPMIQSLRERYKDDPTKLNGEMMTLMRENKVNPIGGCLPMLLQMPVFFALYQVFGQSVELYQAPFVFWINDLTLKDPYFVLPILMGITMFVQQKITPTTMDPMQAKILQWLPVVFSLMMIALPSGLTLYIFVSTLFGVIQQKIFMSSDKPEYVIGF